MFHPIRRLTAAVMAGLHQPAPHTVGTYVPAGAGAGYVTAPQPRLVVGVDPAGPAGHGTVVVAEQAADGHLTVLSVATVAD